MKKTITEWEFQDALGKHFSYDAKKSLWAYFEEFDDGCEEETELDPIGIRCEFNEYETIEDFHKEYSKENYPTLNKLEEHTLVLPFKNSKGFVIKAF